MRPDHRVLDDLHDRGLDAVSAQLGGHVEVLEIDDLRVRVEKVTGAETDQRMAVARDIFTLDDSVVEEDFRWGAQVSVALDRLVDDFGLDSLAYYHRGLDGETHERVAAGLILGASLLTARGIPTCGEYEQRTSLAMLILDRLGAGGSFTELQALNFRANVVEMGHDGPAHLAISSGKSVGHHWALGTGHRVAELEAVADMLQLELRVVRQEELGAPRGGG